MAMHRGTATDDELERLGRHAPSWLRRAVERRYGTRRRARGGARSGSARSAAGPPLHERIAGYVAAVSGFDVVAGYVAHPDFLTYDEETGVVSAWADVYGNFPLSQGVEGARPTFEPTGLAGGPTVSFNGSTQFLDSGAVLDVTGLTGLIWMGVWAGTSGVALGAYNGASVTRYAVARPNSAAEWVLAARNGAVVSAEQNPSTPGTAAVRTGTWDAALATAECTVREGGADTTTGRSQNNNSTSPLTGSGIDTIGIGRGPVTGSSYFNGDVSAALLVSVAGVSVASGVAGAIAPSESDLQAALASGDYLS